MVVVVRRKIWTVGILIKFSLCVSLCLNSQNLFPIYTRKKGVFRCLSDEENNLILFKSGREVGFGAVIFTVKDTCQEMIGK